MSDEECSDKWRIKFYMRQISLYLITVLGLIGVDELLQSPQIELLLIAIS